MCATCTRLAALIKVEKLFTKAQELKKQLIAHKNDAARFYKRLRQPVANECILTLDCEKAQPLPKLSIGAAYFKRQANIANFTVVEGGSKAQLSKLNVTSFVWPEMVAKKGVNEIASSIFHVLKKKNFSEVQNKIILAMDNTVSTNKSQGMLAMVHYFLQHHAPKNIKKVCATK